MTGDKHSINRLRLLGFIEGCSLLILLCIAVPLKHLAGWPLAVEIMGPTHGIALALYMATAVQTLAAGGFNAVEGMRVLAVALIPAGPFFNEGLLRRKQEQSV
jgi:integral membrane protein